MSLTKLNKSAITLKAGYSLTQQFQDEQESKPLSASPRVGFKNPPPIMVDKHFAVLGARKLKPDGTLDVAATNEFRITYATEKGIPPVIARGKKQGYRVTRIDENGLLEFKFASTMPRTLTALSDDETVPLATASAYSGEPESRLRELSKQGRLRISGKRVNLNDLNALKSTP
jgi:hypothetical protein